MKHYLPKPYWLVMLGWCCAMVFSANQQAAHRPDRVDLSPYCPPPGNQGQTSTSAAWAVCQARTMMRALNRDFTHPDSLQKHRFSPGFVYYLVKPKEDPDCQAGVRLIAALEVLNTYGTVPFDTLPAVCPKGFPDSLMAMAKPNQTNRYEMFLNPNNTMSLRVRRLKRHLHKKRPIVLAVNAPPSFYQCGEWWQPKEKHTQEYKYHCVMVLGYDDNKKEGAFRIMNSMGKDWGKNGYAWVSYQDLARFSLMGYYLE